MNSITMIETEVMPSEDQAQAGQLVTQKTGQLAAASAAHPDNLLAYALQNGASMEQLEKLMALKERHEANEARKAYTDDMALAKQNPPTIGKDKFVSFQTSKGVTEYNHATLGNVVRNIIAWLAAHHFSHAWRTEHLDGGRVSVTCTLTHAKGHSESVTLEAGKDDSGGKNSIQALGSAITYLQRYTLLSITGLATDEQDDDGAGSEDEDDEILTQFRNAALLGETALRRHYERHTPSEEFWRTHGKSLKDAARRSDQERQQ